MSHETVCAVVVTFNRKALLRDCLDSLLRQSRVVDQIVIVNNASTDGTAAMLAAEYPQLPVLQQAGNLGGASGFGAGMRWACEHGFDWIWVMDDDVTMVSDALEVMLGYGSMADMIHARKRLSDTVMTWEAVWNVSACTAVTLERDVSFDNGRDWTSVSYSCFEGALIRRTLVEKTGLPDPRFFVAGDDTLYGFLASQHGHVIYIKYIGVEKNAPWPAVRGRMAYYLSLRNRFLTYEILRGVGVPVNRRSVTVQAFISLVRYLIEIAQTARYRKWENVESSVMGLIHGVQGRFGKPYWIPD